MSFSLIFFDYDGVLIDSLQDTIAIGEDFCRLVGTLETLDIMTYPAIVRSIGLPLVQAERFSSYVFDRLHAIGPSIEFFSEIESLLNRIVSKNVAIVSGNVKSVISAKLEAHQLRANINCILGSLEPGDKAEKMRNACNQFELDVRHCCMVGDSLSDIRYAKRVGVQSIAVTWDWQSRDLLVKEDPDFVVNSVQELAALLNA